MNRKVITFIAAIMLILMVLSIFTDMWPDSGTKPEGKGGREDAQLVFEERVRDAKKLSDEQVANYFARMSGYQIGSALARTFPGLRYEYVDTASLLRGLEDALRDSTGIDWVGRWSPLESNAAQVAWVRSKGCGLPDLSKATAEEKDFYERVLRRADALRDAPEQAAADAAYSLGLNMWMLHYSGLPQAVPADMRAESLLAGLRAGLEGGSLPESEAEQQSYAIAMSWWIDARWRAAAAKNKSEGERWMSENARRKGVVTMPSGIQCRALEQGSGEAYDSAVLGSSPTCLVSYELRLVDGRVIERVDEASPVALSLDEGMIPGLSEVLKLMPAGSLWEVALPASLAYGEQAPALIGPESVLVFRIRLHGMIPSERVAAPSASQDEGAVVPAAGAAPAASAGPDAQGAAPAPADAPAPSSARG